MMDDLDSLLGGPPKPVRALKPSQIEAAAKLTQTLRQKRTKDTGKVYDEPEKILEGALPHESEFLKPVGITFLANLMGKQPLQIKKRLAKCPIIGWHEASGKSASQSPLYDFMTAMSYLVPPRGDIEAWFGQQNAASLPPYVNKMWWDSAAQRNKVMRSSGQLWHDDEVRLVFSRVDLTIRQDIKMWIEDLPEKDLLNDKQYNALVDSCNRLVEQIRESLVNMPRETATFSMAHTIKDEMDTAGGTGLLSESDTD